MRAAAIAALSPRVKIFLTKLAASDSKCLALSGAAVCASLAVCERSLLSFPFSFKPMTERICGCVFIARMHSVGGLLGRLCAGM